MRGGAEVEPLTGPAHLEKGHPNVGPTGSCTPTKRLETINPKVRSGGGGRSRSCRGRARRAGCGGGSGASSSHSASAPSASYSQGGSTANSQGGSGGSAAASATTGIPQHNGGDQDADNNGGPERWRRQHLAVWCSRSSRRSLWRARRPSRPAVPRPPPAASQARRIRRLRPRPRRRWQTKPATRRRGPSSPLRPAGARSDPTLAPSPPPPRARTGGIRGYLNATPRQGAGDACQLEQASGSTTTATRATST